MKGLTARQREVFDFIRSFIHTNRYPPTIREIALNFGFSVKGSYDHVKALQKKGFIRCAGNRSRAIEVVADTEADQAAERAPNLVSVPVLGHRGRGQAPLRRGEPHGLDPGARRLAEEGPALRPAGRAATA